MVDTKLRPKMIHKLEYFVCASTLISLLELPPVLIPLPWSQSLTFPVHSFEMLPLRKVYRVLVNIDTFAPEPLLKFLREYVMFVNLGGRGRRAPTSAGRQRLPEPINTCHHIRSAGRHEASRHGDGGNTDSRTNASRADPNTRDGAAPPYPGKGGPSEDLTDGHSNLLGLGSGAPQPNPRNHLLNNP
jgi:hypothetical protein